MKIDRPIRADDEHVVLPFRPRLPEQATSDRMPVGRPAASDHVDVRLVANDLSRYEQPRYEPPRYLRRRGAHDRPEPQLDEADDFRHRMLANIAAFAFTVALTAIGLWLATTIADLRKTQDCVLMGRRDCAWISVPPGG